MTFYGAVDWAKIIPVDISIILRIGQWQPGEWRIFPALLSPPLYGGIAKKLGDERSILGSAERGGVESFSGDSLSAVVRK